MRGRTGGPGRVRAARWAILAVAFALLAAVPAAPPAAAYHTGTLRPMGASVNETVVIPVNNWTAYDTNLTSKDVVTYDIQVTNGSEIDLYILPPSGYTQYQDHVSQSFTYLDYRENSLRFQGTFTGASGRAIFVLDNIDFSGAVPRGNVTVHVGLIRTGAPPGSLPLDSLLLCGPLLAVAIITPLAVMLYNRRKRRALMQSPPPLPPQAPFQYPPPPPPPPPAAQAPAGQGWPPPPPPPPPP